jgi:phenol hydroxylase P2 protein
MGDIAGNLQKLREGYLAAAEAGAHVVVAPELVLTDYPAMVKIEALGRLVIRRASVEERIGRDWDLQELHLSLISLSGSIDETDDEFCLHWG